MTDFISSQVGNEEQDVDLVQDIGGSLLQGMSNSLSASAPRARSDPAQTDGKDEESGKVAEKKQVNILLGQ